ncbi:MAG: hypothetical protein DME85_07180 [Verrucomicrobia bacterium]|nr:MAG: hypothetical protein DME85_07180 [Verrucomicrobiota bacterium]
MHNETLSVIAMCVCNPDRPPTDQIRRPSADEVLRLHKEFLNLEIFLYYKKPLMLVEEKMQCGRRLHRLVSSN